MCTCIECIGDQPEPTEIELVGEHDEYDKLITFTDAKIAEAVKAEIDALKAKLEIAVKALEFYADENHGPNKAAVALTKIRSKP